MALGVWLSCEKNQFQTNVIVRFERIISILSRSFPSPYTTRLFTANNYITLSVNVGPFYYIEHTYIAFIAVSSYAYEGIHYCDNVTPS